MTVPGYTNLVAVTSIWQSLVQEMDAAEEEERLGATVWSTVVGTKTVVGTN
jgi:hypothetical protein